MTSQILILDISGRPYQWISLQHAAALYLNDKVDSEQGEGRITLRGGRNSTGNRSELALAPILTIANSHKMAAQPWPAIALSPRDNTLLFRRDRNCCAYCGLTFARQYLTRDHILARARGGPDTWMNCVTACRECNQKKAALLVQDFRPLIFLPYEPCRYESFILRGRNILADQHDFLATNLPCHSRNRSN